MIRKRRVKQECAPQQHSRGFRQGPAAVPDTTESSVAQLSATVLDELFPTDGHTKDEDHDVIEEDGDHHNNDLTYEVLDMSPINTQHDTLARWLASKPNPDNNSRSVPSPRQLTVADEVQSAVTTQSTYLEDLEAQMRDNAARKKLEEEAEAALEVKLAQEREQCNRYGGGGEPIRGADGQVVGWFPGPCGMNILHTSI